NWKAKNPHFVAASRPRYAALNYTDHPNGACARGVYGDSCLVLKDHMKNQATYSAKDSYSPDVTAQTICTRKTLGALLVWMDEEMLTHLRQAFLQRPIKVLGLLSFLECQMYNDVIFKSDVKELRISTKEVANCPRAQFHVKEFAERHHLPVV